MMKTTKLLLLSSFILACLGGVSVLIFSYYSHREVDRSGLTHARKINWPPGFKPAESAIFLHNEINIKAPPQLVWDIFIKAGKCPEWYSKAEGIRLLNAPDGKLSQSSVFIWGHEGKFTSAVKEFDPPTMIAWLEQADHQKITAYCAWMIIPTQDGCKVVSNQTQNGPKTTMGKSFAFNVAAKHTRDRLARLKQQAENM